MVAFAALSFFKRDLNSTRATARIEMEESVGVGMAFEFGCIFHD
jgi:hypothetical protein